MAESSTLARPYARAAFEYARDSQALAGWAEALALLSTVSLQTSVVSLLASPTLTAAAKMQGLVDICGDKLNVQQQNFLTVLADNHRLTLLPDIQTQFELYKANHEKTVDVAVESAFELSAEQLETLQNSLKKTLDRDISLSSRVNQDLLGGVFVRAGDTVIDASVRGRLDQLASAINA